MHVEPGCQHCVLVWYGQHDLLRTAPCPPRRRAQVHAAQVVHADDAAGSGLLRSQRVGGGGTSPFLKPPAVRAGPWWVLWITPMPLFCFLCFTLNFSIIRRHFSISFRTEIYLYPKIIKIMQSNDILGPRLAHSLLDRMFRNPNELNARTDFVSTGYMGKCIFINASAFLQYAAYCLPYLSIP